MKHIIITITLNLIFSELPIMSFWLSKNLNFRYGIVEFEHPDDAARALRQKTDLIVQGKKLKVIYSRETNGGYSNLYFQNVEEDVSKEEVHMAFR